MFGKLAVYAGKALALAHAEVGRSLPETANEDAKETLAQRQAHAAVALFKLGAAEKSGRCCGSAPIRGSAVTSFIGWLLWEAIRRRSSSGWKPSRT